MTEEAHKRLEEIDRLVRETRGFRTQQPGKLLQILANYLEAFTATFFVLFLAMVVLLPIYVLTYDNWSLGLFGWIVAMIAALSAIWALFFIFGLPVSHSFSKVRRSTWLDWIVRRD